MWNIFYTSNRNFSPSPISPTKTRHKNFTNVVFDVVKKIAFPEITPKKGDRMIDTFNSTLQTQSNLRSEQSPVYTFDSLPYGVLSLRSDHLILLEEALFEQANIHYHISQMNYSAQRFEQATQTYDKASELETLAKKVGSVIESLQANTITKETK